MNCFSPWVISGLSAILSILAAIWIRNCGGVHRVPLGYLLVGLWAIGPPLWFIFEWHRFDVGSQTKEAFETFKYSQELARNVWVVLVVLLGSIVKIKWGGEGET
jgi:hypothetical protein